MPAPPPRRIVQALLGTPKGGRLPAGLLGSQGALSKYTPTMREKLAGLLAKNWYGDSREGYRQAEKLVNVGETVVPPLGLLSGSYDAGRALGGGNMMQAGLLGGLAMLPLPGAAKGIKAYHASPNVFDKIEPSKFRGSAFFASTPERAKKGASAGRNEYIMDTATVLPDSPLHMYEAEINPSKIDGLALKPKEIEWFNNLPEKVVGDDELGAVMGKNAPVYWDDIYDYKQLKDGRFEYTKKQTPPILSYEDAVSGGRDIYHRQWSHYGSGANESGAANRVVSDGMGGYLVQDEGGLSIAVADPSIISAFRRQESGK